MAISKVPTACADMEQPVAVAGVGYENRRGMFSAQSRYRSPVGILWVRQIPLFTHYGISTFCFTAPYAAIS